MNFDKRQLDKDLSTNEKINAVLHSLHMLTVMGVEDTEDTLEIVKDGVTFTCTPGSSTRILTVTSPQNKPLVTYTLTSEYLEVRVGDPDETGCNQKQLLQILLEFLTAVSYSTFKATKDGNIPPFLE